MKRFIVNIVEIVVAGWIIQQLPSAWPPIPVLQPVPIDIRPTPIVVNTPAIRSTSVPRFTPPIPTPSIEGMYVVGTQLVGHIYWINKVDAEAYQYWFGTPKESGKYIRRDNTLWLEDGTHIHLNSKEQLLYQGKEYGYSYGYRVLDGPNAGKDVWEARSWQRRD